MTLKELCAQYPIYHKMPAFKLGFMDYQLGIMVPEAYNGVEAQAYDRGAEAAMRWERQQREG